MVQIHHSDNVVTPNIYLNTKRYEPHAQDMHASCFNIQAQKYEVLEDGGKTSEGEHHGAKRLAVNLSENTCTYGVRQLIHVPCLHIIVVCNCLDQNFYVSHFMTTYNTLEALVLTWSPHFVLFSNEDQWEPYDGPRYVADKAMMWKKRGPKRCTRYAMEMDRVKSGRSKRWIVNIWRTSMRFVALNATKLATIDEDVKRTYVLRIWCLPLIYFRFYSSFLP
jgi:hypothetical protein